MQTTSSVYQAILQEENYHFEVKLNIAGSDYGQDVIFSMKSDSRLFESSPTIGGTYSGTLEFSLLGDGADIPRMAVVKPYYRAVGASQTSEWLQKGEYYIDTRSVSQNEGGIVVFNAFCYDAMLKANAPYASSTLSWPATPKQVVNEIAGKMGVTITSYASTVLNLSYISIPMPVQYNMREVLGFIAAAYGGNWFINYEGQLDFKELYMMGLGSAQLAVGTNVSSLNVSPNRGAYTKVILDVDDETAYESGTDETNVLEATCPYATQAVADRVLSELTQYSFLYKPFEAIGCWTNPAVELTDSITFTDTSVLRPVCARTINFGPAMVMDLTAPNDNDIDHEYAFESPTERNYKRTTANVINQLNVNAEGISLVSQKLNNIGGRNILRNSATAHWVPLNSPTVTFEDGVTVTEWGTNEAMRAYGTGGATRATLQFLNVTQANAIYLANMTYTMSVYLKNNHQTNAISLGCNGSLEDVIVEPGEAKRVSLSIQGDGSTALRMYIRTPSPGDAFDFTWWHPQIEYGEVMTSWNPAPEDKVGNDEIIAKINISPENITISANKVDLQGYVTFSNLSTSGQTAINGGNITTGLIQDQAGKNSWNLNTGALTITEGSVNITTSSETESVIQLRYGQYSSFFQPQAVGAAITSSNGTFSSAVQANGIRIDGADGKTSFVDRSSFTVYDSSTIIDRLVLGTTNGLYFKDSAGVKRFQVTPTGAITIYASSASSTEYAIGSWSGGTLKLGTSDTAGSWPGYIEMYDSNHNPRITIAAGTGIITSQTGANKYSVLIWPDSANNGAGRLVLGDGNSTLWRTSLTNDGLTFRNSSDAVTAQYPSYGPAIRSTKTLTSSSSVKITFAAESVAIISAIGYLGNAYGVFLYTGYALGSARQHITKLLGDAAVSMTINESDQSVTLSYTGAATMYVSALPLYGNPPTFS